MKKLDFSIIKAFVESKNGTLLSDVYVNARTKLEILCSNGHSWFVLFHDIKQGYWCPHCVKLAKPTLKTLQDFALNKNGKLLSTIYVNSNTKLLWQCNKNHTWETSWHCIKNGTWCPKCKNKTEALCREILESWFKKPFPNTKFYYSGRKFIELDCYNKELNLALEYNGEQHYKKLKHFHRGSRSLEKQQQQDLIKQSWCKENNICLIVVPYTEKPRLSFFIKSKLSEYLPMTN